MAHNKINLKFLNINREGWNIRTPIHLQSDFYDVESFRRKGKPSLNPPELKLLGNVKGKHLLHLQCHFGLDTLSLAKLGAVTTGVDFSEVSIEAAQELSEETGIPSTFICADVQTIDSQSLGEFDIVYTSYGVLPWLENLNAWAKGIITHLKPGGQFVLVEYHPIVDLFHSGQISGWNSYFGQGKPSEEIVSGTYTDRSAPITFNRYTWQHNISEVVMSLVFVGLVIRDFQEYPFCSYPLFSELEIHKDGMWFPKGECRIPYMYSLVAEKPEANMRGYI